MFLVLQMSQYDIDNVYFVENHRNINDIDITNPQFIRFIYSINNFSLNCISIHIPLNLSNVDKYYNKYKCSFSIQENTDIVKFIKSLEKTILDHPFIHNYHNNKYPLYNLSDQIQTGELKLYQYNENINIILKISGIWCSGDYYGITYKFLSLTRL
jgi:hypothetical protein